MATKPECHDAVRSFVKSLKPAMKLSLPALETLAVIAYKQPVTAPEVNEIRGVDSSGVFGSLLARKLIVTAGRKPVVGRPILYKTTREFLLRFGLKDVSELPSMEEFEKMAASELDEPEMAQEETTADEAARSLTQTRAWNGMKRERIAPRNRNQTLRLRRKAAKLRGRCRASRTEAFPMTDKIKRRSRQRRRRNARQRRSKPSRRARPRLRGSRSQRTQDAKRRLRRLEEATAAKAKAKATVERAPKRVAKAVESKATIKAPEAKTRKTKAKDQKGSAGYRLGEPIARSDWRHDRRRRQNLHGGMRRRRRKAEMEAFRADTTSAAMDSELEAAVGPEAAHAAEEGAREAAEDAAAQNRH